MLHKANTGISHHADRGLVRARVRPYYLLQADVMRGTAHMRTPLQSGLDISAAVTHRFPAAQFKEAFEIMRTGQSGKVVLDWAA